MKLSAPVGGQCKQSRHIYTDSMRPCTICNGKGVAAKDSEAARKGK